MFTKESRRCVMSSSEGGAVRVQLDGLISSLAAADEAAAQAGDTPVTDLLTLLHEARAVSVGIERRGAVIPHHGVYV